MLPGVDASHVYVRAWALGGFHGLSEGADLVGGQLRGDKECPFSDVTKSCRVWRKVPENGARSVGRNIGHHAGQPADITVLIKIHSSASLVRRRTCTRRVSDAASLSTLPTPQTPPSLPHQPATPGPFLSLSVAASPVHCGVVACRPTQSGGTAMESHCQCGFCHPTPLQHSAARRRVINSVCLPPFAYFLCCLLRLSPSLHLTLSAACCVCLPHFT